MKTFVLLGLIAAAAASSPASAALLINGNFEGQTATYQVVPTGAMTLPGWTATRAGFEWFQPQAEYNLGPAQSGLSIVDVAFSTGGGISQSFATVAGQRYELSFFGMNSTFAGRSGTGVIDTSIDGNVQSFTVTRNAVTWNASDWQPFTRRFTGTGAAMTLEFSNSQNENTNFAFFDSAAISAVPESATWALMILGFGLVGGAMRRQGRGPNAAVRFA